MDNGVSPKKLDNRHAAHWELQPGFVYFIGAGEPLVAIKIGISTSGTMKSRLRGLQSSNHEPLRILGLIHFQGMEKPMAEANRREIELHARFETTRRFKSGPGNEWFTPSEELLEYIDKNSAKPETFALKSTIATLGPGLSK